MTKDVTKLALRRAAERKLPKKSAMMPKIGFITPINDWMREDRFYQRIRDAFTGEAAEKFFKRDALLAMLDEHKAGHNGSMKRIWAVYCFLVWYNEFFGEKPLYRK